MKKLLTICLLTLALGARAQAVLQFETDNHDFGNVPEGTMATYEFKFKNTGNQPAIMAWNLARLAEALLPFFDADEARAVALANARLEAIAGLYRQAWAAEMRRKLGLTEADEGDAALVDDLLALMPGRDWTLSFRRGFDGLGDWRRRWLDRAGPGAEARALAANPAVIPRNHTVEAALQAAVQGDMGPFDDLLTALRNPFGPEAGRERFVLPPPEGLTPYVTFCGT